ncbi:MAG: PVC-type heme-binding CxxCH protein, partial [Pirellulales bacterium]
MNHRALCAWCLAIAAVLAHVNVSEADEPAAWTAVPVPGCWEDAADGQFAGHDGYAWYRCLVKIPPHWRGRNLKLLVEHVDNVHEAFFNGVKVGGAGKFPSDYQNGIEVAAEYDVLAEHVRPADTNLLAIRVYDHDGRGGFKGIAPAVISGIDAISLAGDWEFRTGDDADWSDPAKSLPTVALAAFEQVGETALLKEKSKDGPLSPAEALAKFIVPDDLQAEVVLSEPLVAQPLYITFDERGRMWVAQYLQYPFPAGLKILSEDKFLRATYDKVPPPPPNHFVGADKITIHEDTDGDGAFDQHKTFVDGLNICVAALPAYDGVWVMNPPYLLFYPDRNHDDVPDGDPEVHLQGFGMEDTHSVASNLQFGPDGWIYASQGSTVSGDIIRPGLDKKPVHSLGQLIWRYHPPTKRYEIFAEGGGNAFGVEIDSQGRVFSGHNGGDTRGFHYVQGGYYQKGFGKHGPLSNPFTFGYFPAMKHPAVPRFTHTYVINEGGALGAAHEGNMFAVAPLQGQVIESDLQRDGSTFQTTDIVHSMTTPDTRFRPVEIKIGPDGALYVGDWYEEQIAHLRHHEGRIDPTNGRIYRLKAKGAKPIAPFDLSQKSSAELVEVLSHPNKWFRRMALRLLAERRDASIVPSLKKLLAEHNGQLALEALWALNLSGGFDEATALAALDHPFAPVRTWTVRLLGDEGRVSSAMAARLASLAKDEAYVDVRSQLACTARRLPAAQCLPIVKALVAHDEDLNDPHLPLLLWWAIESKCESDPAAVVEFFVDPAVWKGKL